jgi:hypothetical protein
MHRTKRIDLILIATLLPLAPACGRVHRPASARPAQATQEKPAEGPLTGTASCGGRGCHGGFETSAEAPGSTWRFAYTRWLHHDPHVWAHDALSSDLAKSMEKVLGIRAAQDPRCLACHTNPQATGTQDWAREERDFGVGCEACHGPARDWLVPHRGGSWRELSAKEKRARYRQYGMTWLTDLSDRARVCTGCHVGAAADKSKGIPTRDVTHEFIAAGHPRLTFEFGAYLANEPRHWDEKITAADFEARAWGVGQVVSLEAALSLLIDRTTRSADWPELSEYDCYACHHPIESESWRRAAQGKPGAIRPGRWYSALVPAFGGAPDLGTLEKALARRSPDPKRIAAEARKALAPLAPLAGKLEAAPPLGRPALARLRVALVGHVEQTPTAGWDEVEQLALALSALNAVERNGDVGKATGALLKQLAFPRDHTSPVGFRRDRAFDGRLKTLFQQLRAPGLP